MKIKLTKNYENPFARRWINEVGADSRGIEKRLMQMESNHAESAPVYTCSKCGEKCYYRPAVGGWWCIKCGNLEVS